MVPGHRERTLSEYHGRAHQEGRAQVNTEHERVFRQAVFGSNRFDDPGTSKKVGKLAQSSEMTESSLLPWDGGKLLTL